MIIRMLIVLVASVFLSSCMLSMSSTIETSKLLDKKDVVVRMKIVGSNSTLRKIESILDENYIYSKLVSEEILYLDYTIHKSGSVSSRPEDFTWGVFFAKNRSIIIFIKESLLYKLKKERISSITNADNISLSFNIRNDLEHPIMLSVGSIWVNGYPESISRTYKLAPNQTINLKLSELSLHYILRNGVEPLGVLGNN